MTLVTRLSPQDGVSPDKQQLYTTRPTNGQSRALLLAWVGFWAREETSRPDPRRRAAALSRRPVRRDAPGDRRLPPLDSALVGVEPEQAGGLGAAGPADPRPLCGPPARGAPVHGRGVRFVHRPPRRALRDLGRHLAPRGPRGDADHEYGIPRARVGAGLVHRHHRGLDAPDPAVAANQPRAHARPPHDRVLHLSRVQHRRDADTARRPTALPRLPARRALHVDPPTLGALGAAGGRAAGAVLRLGYAAIHARADRGAAPRSLSDRAVAPARRAQPPLARPRHLSLCLAARAVA